MSKRTPEEETLRNELRAATLGAPTPGESKLIKIGDREFEVRQPTLAVRDRILQGCKDADGNTLLGKMSTLAAINCTFLPGTQVRVFDDADLDAMLNTRAGSSFVDTLGAAAVQLMTKLAEAKGNG